MLSIQFGVRVDMSSIETLSRALMQIIGEADDIETEKSDKFIWETETGATVTLRGVFSPGYSFGSSVVKSVEIHAADNSLIMSAKDLKDYSSEDLFDDGDVEEVLEQIERGATITGSRFNDVLVGGDDDDILMGAAGHDVLKGMGGNDELQGGTGNDTYFIDGNTEINKNISDPGIDTVKSSAGYSLGARQENIVLLGNGNINATGNSIGNKLYGTSGSNLIQGGGGNDRIEGGAGNDRLEGGAGNDLLIGGPGADLLSGAGGDDTYVIAKVTELNKGLSDPGVDLVRIPVAYTLGVQQENLTLLGTWNINGTGNAKANVLIGNNKNNVLSGSGGDDTLNGAGGADILNGGLGNDMLAGSGGNDIFLFNTAPGGSNVDTIMDFGGAGSTALDLIRLDDAIYSALATGALASSAFESAPGLTAAATTDGRIIYDTDTGALYYDADGSGTGSVAIQFAVIGGNLSDLSAEDFVVA